MNYKKFIGNKHGVLVFSLDNFDVSLPQSLINERGEKEKEKEDGRFTSNDISSVDDLSSETHYDNSEQHYTSLNRHINEWLDI